MKHFNAFWSYGSHCKNADLIGITNMIKSLFTETDLEAVRRNAVMFKDMSICKLGKCFQIVKSDWYDLYHKWAIVYLD